MRPRFFPRLVNGRFGDPVVFVDFLHERRAILFDLGDISALSPRALLRISDVFVSHTHIDHFYGFDRLLRHLVGRNGCVRLYGPAGFLANVEAKLSAYTWNLAEAFRDDLVFEVLELGRPGTARRARFRLSTRFAREAEEPVRIRDGIIRQEPSLTVRFAELAHRTPCIAFALQEPAHVNIWRNALDPMGLATGPWLRDLKQAVHHGLPENTPIAATRKDGTSATLPLGTLKDRILSLTAGQKIAYVTDTAHTPATRRAIVDLAGQADTLFIEAPFAEADAARAAETAHLTTRQAGTLARLAGVRQLEPFHFSPRYEGEDERLRREVTEAFAGQADS